MKQVASKHNLLEAREKALADAVKGVIRPHGKLWGMDVFSWMNPDLEAITSTIHSFPFPLILIGNSSLLSAIEEIDSTIVSNIRTVISYEDNKDTNFLLNKFETIYIADDVKSALQKMVEYKFTPGVLLFCGEGIDTMMCQNELNNYLELHQI